MGCVRYTKPSPQLYFLRVAGAEPSLFFLYWGLELWPSSFPLPPVRFKIIATVYVNLRGRVF